MKSGDPDVQDIATIIEARDEVIARYQSTFSPDSLPDLQEEAFRQFLYFRNNKHWWALQRVGSAVCEDMDRLREALRILLDESRPINERLTVLVPLGKPAYVPRMSRGVLTPILLICHPDRYGVWNQLSEGSMKALGLWPDLERGLPFGDRYKRVNEVLLEVAKAVDVDLWTLDALWWRGQELLNAAPPETDDTSPKPEEPFVDQEGAKFGLERHLHEFLRDNWNHTDLGQDWVIYEEDGDPDVGYEYPCGIGRIDLLARHRNEPRWLVIELKRNQTSDATVGQVLRYMGWVKQKMAEPDDSVEGLVIAHKADEQIRFALSAVSDVDLKLYEVEFRLRGAD